MAEDFEAESADTADEREPLSLGWVIVPLVMGAIILGVLAWIYTQQQAFASIAAATTGTVIDLIRETDNEGYVSFAPRIRFTTAGGREQEYTSNIGTNPASYTIGQTLEILYNPENPQEAVIAADNALETNVPMQIFTGIGALLLVFGGMMLVVRLMRGEKPD